jgi:hypothetical protein
MAQDALRRFHGNRALLKEITNFSLT